MHIGTLTNTDLPLTPPPPSHGLSGDPGKLQSIWLITGKERERAEGEWREGGEAASSVSSEIGGAGVTKALFHRRDRERRKRRGWRKGGKKPSMTKRDAADTPATRHQTIKTNKAPLCADVCRNYRFGGQISSQEVLSLTLPP